MGYTEDCGHDWLAHVRGHWSLLGELVSGLLCCDWLGSIRGLSILIGWDASRVVIDWDAPGILAHNGRDASGLLCCDWLGSIRSLEP